MARTELCFPGGLKFNLASVKFKHNYEKKYFERVLGHRMRNITSHATIPNMTVCVSEFIVVLTAEVM